jgi:protein-S-isoprenylcysteine O-methyltransferase Ste14
MGRRHASRSRAPYVLAYVGLNVVASLLWFATVGRKHPDLARERLHPGPGAKDSLSRDLALLLPPTAAHYLIAALDVWRWHWTDTVSPRGQLAGLLGMALATGVFFWATWVNAFLSSVVRIQRDRGHHLVTDGPYRYVRHPFYTAMIVYLVCSGLALGSWLSLLPLPAWIAFFLDRIRLEERVLAEELEGYRDYARRVRYRLLPGIW